jgi:type V secretory pathway adhesin AidA
VPSTYDAATSTTPASTAVLTVPPVAAGYADAVITNDPLGVVEVCKDFSPSAYDANNSATFTVTDGTINDTVTVNGGECSAPIWVSAGAATVSEASDPGFYLENDSTESASDPRVRGS